MNAALAQGSTATNTGDISWDNPLLALAKHYGLPTGLTLIICLICWVVINSDKVDKVISWFKSKEKQPAAESKPTHNQVISGQQASTIQAGDNNTIIINTSAQSCPDSNRAFPWQPGDLLKFTSCTQGDLHGVAKGAEILSSKEEVGIINELLISLIREDPSRSEAVADLSRMSSILKDSGLSEQQIIKLINGDLQYLISNMITYRAMARCMLNFIKGSQLLQQMQLAMYAYCWIFGPNADHYSRAFEIARLLDHFKDKWFLIPGDLLRQITDALDDNAPLSKGIDSGLPGILSNIVDNPAIHDDTRELLDEVLTDFGIIVEILDGCQSEKSSS